MDRRLLVLALGMFALGTDSFVVAGVLPEIARDFNVSIGAAGQMTTIYAATIAVLAPVIAAAFASRWNCRGNCSARAATARSVR